MSKKGNAYVDSFKIKVNNDLISDDQDIANVFNEYFVSIPCKLKEPIQTSDFKSPSRFR